MVEFFAVKERDCEQSAADLAKDRSLPSSSCYVKEAVRLFGGSTGKKRLASEDRGHFSKRSWKLWRSSEDIDVYGREAFEDHPDVGRLAQRFGATSERPFGRDQTKEKLTAMQSSKAASTASTEEEGSQMWHLAGRRLPGRDIPISSDEESEDEGAKTDNLHIEVVEDPRAKKAPKKPTLVLHTSFKDAASAKVEYAGAEGGPKRLGSVEFSSDDVPCGEVSQENHAHIRKRSVSFLPEDQGKAGKQQVDKVLIEDGDDADVKGEKKCPPIGDRGEEEIVSMREEMNRLRVSSTSRERRKSIESIIRPPTPPNASHSIRHDSLGT